MKRRLLIAAWMMTVFFVAAAPAAGANLLVNGNWSTGDETGWTRWYSSGSAHNWSVWPDGSTPPAGTLSCQDGQSVDSFGWYQVAYVPMGWTVHLDGDWSGTLADCAWAEVRLFSVAPGTTHNDIVARIDSISDPDMVSDRWEGSSVPDTWGWESILLSSSPGGNGGTIVNTEGYVVVALDAGSLVGGAATVSFDNLTLTPEPATMTLLGVGLAGLVVRRKRRH